jgi:hypothetical protein
MEKTYDAKNLTLTPKRVYIIGLGLGRLRLTPLEGVEGEALPL